VAELAGVSQSTVSRVLSAAPGSGLISDETAQRVRDAARQLGYSPNPIARALRGEHTHLIGLVVREIADPFFAGVIETLTATARKANYGMILSHAHSDPREGLEMARVLDSRQCDGVVFLGDLRDDQAVLRTILSERHPVVALCRGQRVRFLPTVNCDNRSGVHLLIDHLLGLGHRRIAFIHGGWIGDIRDRLEAFLEFKDNHPEGDLFTWLPAKTNNSDGGYQAMRSLLDLVPRPTAVMAADDAMAIGALKAAFDSGLTVPDDISITGFDDIGAAQFTIPSLTTVRQPIESMAVATMELMMSQIRGEDIPEGARFIEIMPELVIRDSTGVPRSHS
jgi:LacI family repressor for deo operon, udp, cdd, tsx, nupC, and nupG